MPTPFLVVYAVLATGLVVGLLLVLRSRSREADRLGTVLTRERGARGPRIAVAVVLLAAAALRLLADGGLAPLWLDLSMVGLGLALTWIHPAPSDRTCGERGVRAGWTVLAFAEFAEWRLTGDHLRFRAADGEWQAVGLPAERHAALRARLESDAAGRESRFSS